MSYTTETDAAPRARPITNYSCVVGTATANGQSYKEASVTFGEPSRTLKVREPDMGDQFDLLELGGAATSNETWMGMALVANAITSVDGESIQSFRGDRLDIAKLNLRKTIKKLGPVGLAAAGKAIADMSVAQAGTEATVEAAKN